MVVVYCYDYLIVVYIPINVKVQFQTNPPNPTICQSPTIKNLPDTIEVPAFVNDPSQAMKCLTSLAKGSTVTIDQCNGSQTQKWDFTFYKIAIGESINHSKL